MQTKTLSLTRILLLCGVIAGPLFILIVQQACNVNWLDGRIRDRHKAFLCSGYDSTDARPLAQDISLRQTCKDSKMQAKRDTPERMFVTCFYAILEPASGKMRYANAGHDLPYQRHEGSVCELRATGMPLGLMPGMSYEEKETTLMPGDSVLFYSDGLVEAHNPNSEMFGFPRLMSLLKERMDDSAMTHFLLDHLKYFENKTGVSHVMYNQKSSLFDPFTTLPPCGCLSVAQRSRLSASLRRARPHHETTTTCAALTRRAL